MLFRLQLQYVAKLLFLLSIGITSIILGWLWIVADEVDI